MNREIRIAISLAGLVATWVAALVVLVRWLVPMILSARFDGAMPVAVAVGVIGVMGLAWLAWLILCWARRAFSQ